MTMENRLDQTPCICFGATEEGVISSVNDYLCRLLHYNQHELVGHRLDLLFTTATRIFQQTHFFPLLKLQGYAEEIFITLKKKDGETVPVLINAVRVSEPGQQPYHLYAGIVVHQRKKFEEELIAAKNAAEKALSENTELIRIQLELQKRAEQLDEQMSLVNKQNEELRQFNRIVTHDVEEPLRKLFIFTNMLLESSEYAEKKQVGDKITRVMNQMRSIISGLQQYVWLIDAPVRLVPIHLSTLIHAVVQQLREEAPNVDIEITTEGLETISGDKEQIKMLFYQILSNAIRFRKEECKAYITISSETIQINQFRSLEGKYKYVEFFRLRIQDKGIGFDPVYKEQTFELFKKLHPNSGRGVGLSLCKQIVDNHKGFIKIDSIPGENTTVEILLPLTFKQDPLANTADGMLDPLQHKPDITI